jgi:GNAT superfamily N-acetyltransferase
MTFSVPRPHLLFTLVRFGTARQGLRSRTTGDTPQVTEMPMVRRMREDDWAQVREIRLVALQDSPTAFASTYQREVAFDEATWRSRTRTAAWFLAYDGTRAVGLVAGIHEEGAPAGERHVVSFWVAPERRGRGVAGALLDTVIDWAREQGADVVTLWVVDGNDPAIRLYVRHGFQATGESQPVPGSVSTIESKLALRLSACG